MTQDNKALKAPNRNIVPANDNAPTHTVSLQDLVARSQETLALMKKAVAISHAKF